MRALARVVLAAALWVVGVGAAGALAAGVGGWTPWVAWPVAVVAAVVAGWVASRVPTGPAPAGRAEEPATAGAHVGARPDRVAALALLVVCTGFTVWVGATHSEQVLVRRDAASNLQAAVSLARTGERVVEVDAADVGGPGVLALPGVTLASPAFYQTGPPGSPSVQPQFVVGPAVVHAYGWWLGGSGPAVALVLPAVAAGLALLGLGVLVARVVGPWWGVVAAGVCGLLFPVVHTPRATYSEPLALLTLAGGLLALTGVAGRGAVASAPVAPTPVPATPRDGGVAPGHLTPAALRYGGAVAGVLVGGTGLVRVDALREAVLLVPALALAAAVGERWVRPAAAGLAAALAVAAGAALWLSPRYLGDIGASLVPLLALGVAVSVGSLVLLWWWRRGARLPSRLVAWPPDLLAGGVVAAGLYLASRPLWQAVRQDPTDPGARYVAGMQARQGLPVDGGRTYAEHTVAWLSWYAGPVALVVALAVLALLVRRAVLSLRAGRLEAWLPALLVVAGSTLLTLLRPGITPDHPWATRRLLLALPLVVVLVVVAAAWSARRRAASGRGGASSGVRGGDGRSRWSGPVVAGALIAVLAVPAAVATWPHRAGGVERGSYAAVLDVCARLSPDDVVLAVDSRAANEWPQVVRGTCGVPALALTAGVRRDPAEAARTVAAVRQAVESGGGAGRLVLLAADGAESLVALGAAPVAVVDVLVREDQHLLERRPDGTDPLPVRVWLDAEAVAG